MAVTAIPRRPDPCTLSNIGEVQTTHTTANFTIDFEKKRLVGNVILRLKASEACNKIVLDTSHVKVKDVQINGSKAQWELKPRSEPYGSPLHVETGVSLESGESVEVKVLDQKTNFNGRESY